MTTQIQIEEHAKTYQKAFELTGNTDAAIAILSECGKDTRMQHMREQRANEPATEKQLNYFKQLGGTPQDGMTKSQASQAIENKLEEKKTTV